MIPGDQPPEQISTETIEAWHAGELREGELSRRSVQTLVVLLNGVSRRAREVWKLPVNPVAEVERQRGSAGSLIAQQPRSSNIAVNRR